MSLAGFPAITLLLPKLLVTTDPAPTTQPSPNRTPGRIITLPPIQQLFPMVTGLMLPECCLHMGIPLSCIP